MFIPQDTIIIYMIVCAVYCAFALFAQTLLDKATNKGVALLFLPINNLMSLAGGFLFVYSFLNFYNYTQSLSIALLGVLFGTVAISHVASFEAGKSLMGRGVEDKSAGSEVEGSVANA